MNSVKNFICVCCILFFCSGYVAAEAQSAQTKNPDQEGIGAITIEVSDENADLFVVPFEPGIDFDSDNRFKLRDIMLESSPSAKNETLTLKTGKYVVAVRTFLPRESLIINELSYSSPDTIVIGAAKGMVARQIVGYGVKTGALFKAVKDVYLTFEGFLFATGPGKPNKQNRKKYEYLEKQGTKDLMFRFLEGKPDCELWLLGDVDIKAGDDLQMVIKVPEGRLNTRRSIADPWNAKETTTEKKSVSAVEAILNYRDDDAKSKSTVETILNY